MGDTNTKAILERSGREKNCGQESGDAISFLTANRSEYLEDSGEGPSFKECLVGRLPQSWTK